MDRANTPVPGLISSLESMIDASVSAALDRRLGPARNPLSVQVDDAVTSALDRRLGLAGVDLENHIEVSVARAVRQRFGPLGSAISAHIILGAPQPPVRQSTPLSHDIVPRIAARVLSLGAARNQTPLRDLPHDIELAKTQLEGLDDNDGDYAFNKMVMEHDLAALHERYTAAVGAGTVQQQEGSRISRTSVTEENASGLQVEEVLQMVEDHAMEDRLFVHSPLPAEKKTPPQGNPLNTAVQRLEASNTGGENPVEHDSTAAQIRLDRVLGTYQSDYVTNIYSQGKGLEYVEVVKGNLPDDSDEAGESLFVETEDLDHSISLFPGERTAGSIEKTSTFLRMDEHPESLSKGPYIAAEGGITIEEIIAPSSAGGLQLSAAKMANGKVREVIPFAQRETDAPANRRPLSGKPSPPPKTLPQLDSAVIVRSSPGCNSVPMKEQNKSLSRGLAEASTQEFPSLLEASRAKALRKCSPPTDPGQTASIEAKKLLFVEQGRILEAPSKVEKRKASTLESAAETLAESNKTEAPQKRKSAKVSPPGYTEGPSIRFLKVCSQLTARYKGGRGYPRVVDLESFTVDSNKQNFTMADIVATILWNHKPESLKAFLDIETKPSFSFVRKESDKERPNFAIERMADESGTKVKVKVGYHARSPGHLWHECYEYSVEANGRWDPIRHDAPSFRFRRRKIQEAAVAFGSDVFQRKVWGSGDGVEIVIL